MLLSHPLSTIAPTLDGDVLCVLAGADEWFTPRTVVSLAGDGSINGVRKTLARLVRQGVVLQRNHGQQYTYRLNREHLAAPAILELARLRLAYLGRLREHLAQWAVQPAFAALFGSAARGEMGEDSDIDLFIVRPTIADDVKLRTGWDGQVRELAAASTRWTGNDTRVLEMGEAEVRDGLDTGDGVVLSVRDEGIELAGSAQFWREVAYA